MSPQLLRVMSAVSLELADILEIDDPSVEETATAAVLSVVLCAIHVGQMADLALAIEPIAESMRPETP